MPRKQWTKSVAEQWDLFLPPARPSLSELASIEELLLTIKRRKKDCTVAIMGSTPEYRDLCQTTNTDYKCIEYSRKNFLTLGQYCLHKDDETRLILSDWRDIRCREKFDLFIGDLFTCVAPVADHALLYKNIQQHCFPGAHIVIKVALRKDNRRMTHRRIFQHYRKHLSFLNPFAAVWHEVLIADYDFKADTMNCQTSLRRLTDSYRHGVITKYEWTEFKKRWDALGDFKMNVPLQREFLTEAAEFFSVKGIICGRDWYSEKIPLVMLRCA